MAPDTHARTMPRRRRAKGPDLLDATIDLEDVVRRTAQAMREGDPDLPRISGFEYERLKKAVDAYDRAMKREQRAGRV